MNAMPAQSVIHPTMLLHLCTCAPCPLPALPHPTCAAAAAATAALPSRQCHAAVAVLALQGGPFGLWQHSLSCIHQPSQGSPALQAPVGRGRGAWRATWQQTGAGCMARRGDRFLRLAR